MPGTKSQRKKKPITNDQFKSTKRKKPPKRTSSAYINDEYLYGLSKRKPARKSPKKKVDFGPKPSSSAPIKKQNDVDIENWFWNTVALAKKHKPISTIIGMFNEDLAKYPRMIGLGEHQ